MANIDKVPVGYYDSYTALADIMKKNLGVESTDDVMVPGLINAVVQQMALIAHNTALHTMAVDGESRLNTAIKPESIYGFAKMYNVDVTTATPASSDVMFSISTSALDEMILKRTGNNEAFAGYGNDVLSLGNKHCFIIDRSNQIVSGEYYFALERSIMIYKSEDNGYIVKYITTENPSTTQFGDMDQTFIKTVITSSEGEQYLSFIVPTYQYKITKIERQITSSSFIETKYHEYTFEDQLAGMSLKYKKNNKTEIIDLRYSENGLVTSNRGYYTITDSNKLEISFKQGQFMPTIGGTLILELYTTKGAGGNVSFTGESAFSLSDEDYRTLAITTEFVNKKATGGVDAPTLESIKNEIVQKISTNETIVTESDLNTHFAKLSSLFEINDGQLKFLKKRSDIIKRIFNAYVLVRSGMSDNETAVNDASYRSRVVPTNTVDVSFSIGESGTTSITGPVFNCGFGQGVSVSLDGNKVKYVASDSQNPDYVIPFYMMLQLAPYKKVKYLYNLTNDTQLLKYTSIKSSGYNLGNITPSTVNLLRNSNSTNNGQAFYTLTFSFSTTFDMAAKWNKENKVSLRLYKSRNIFEEISNIKVESTGENDIKLQITSEKLEDSGDADIYDTKFIFTLPVASEEFSADSSNKEDYGTFIHILAGSSTKLLPEDIYAGLVFNDVRIDSAVLDMEFKSADVLSLFKGLDDIMSSDMIVRTDTNGKITSIEVKEVPVVHTSFLNSDVAQNNFISKVFKYISLLKSNANALETNTSYNLKFMNTYGLSHKYNCVSTNIKLELYVYVNDASIGPKIKDYIRRLVDKANDEGYLRVSKIITLTELKFAEYIDHIDFAGLNGTFNQFIEPVSTTTSDVPEYFNLDSESLDDDDAIHIVEIQ